MNIPLSAWCVVGLALAGCQRQDAASGRRPSFVVSPSVIEPPFDPSVWLVKMVSIQTDEPTTVELVVSGPDGVRTISFPERDTTHTQPLLGLRANTNYTLMVRATGERSVESELIDIATDPLPELFPNLEVMVSLPERMEPGYTLLPVTSEELGYLVALDAAGEPVWLTAVSPHVKAVSQTPDGGYISIDDLEIRKIDALGNTVKRFVAQPTEPYDVPLGGFVDPHHEVLELPDGRVFTFVWQSTHEPAYPQSYSNFGLVAPADVQDDVVLEMSPEGVALGQWPLSQFVPTARIGYNSLEIERDNQLYDWVHGNSIDYDEDEDALTVSMRHQDAVLRFDRATSELQWIFGHPFRWGDLAPYVLTATGELLWPSHQHAAMTFDSGRGLILFDNGNYEHATPYYPSPQPGEFSRMVAYGIDADSMTVEQRWSFEQPSRGRLYSGVLGNADELPITGNMLGTWGSINVDHLGPNTTAARGLKSLRVIEVDRVTSEIVWEVSAWSDRAELSQGWSTDRATRIPSLYPPGVEESLGSP
jgi:arylsulfate sulfotransferase